MQVRTDSAIRALVVCRRERERKGEEEWLVLECRWNHVIWSKGSSE